MTKWFRWKNVKEGVHLEEMELCGQIVLKGIFKFDWEKFKWIDVSQDGDNVITFENTVVNIWFHKRGRELFDYMRK
jgi:hypothetical protein